MTKYVTDTQLLIRAMRYAAEAERLKIFLSAFAPSVYLCSVVAQELLAGARPEEMRSLERTFILPFERLERAVAPTHPSWTRAGRILQLLRRSGYTITPALTNDVLIAVSAVQIGATVIHDNERDYAAISRHLPALRHTTVWPVPRP